jgi:hypothetical protein
MSCNQINVSYQRHWHPQIYLFIYLLIHLFCLFPFHNEIWNNFWGNSLNSKMIFTLQRRTVRIIAGVKSRTSCRNLFVSSEILPVAWEYIFALMNFVVNNQEHFQTNTAIHSVNTRNRDHVHRRTTNLSWKCVLCWHQILQLSTIKSQKSYE